MPFHATKTLPKKCLTTQVLNALRKREKCIPIDAVLMGRLAGSPVTAPLGLFCATGVGTTKGSGGGGGIRILTNDKPTVNVYIYIYTHTTRTHADKNTLEITSINTPFFFFFSNSGSRKFRLVGSRALYRAACRLKRCIHIKKGLIYQEKQVSI